MLWVPLARVLVVKVATPPLNAAAPRTVEPSLKVTVPVAADGLSVAVNCTLTPAPAGLLLEVSVTVDGAKAYLARKNSAFPTGISSLLPLAAGVLNQKDG